MVAIVYPFYGKIFVDIALTETYKRQSSHTIIPPYPIFNFFNYETRISEAIPAFIERLLLLNKSTDPCGWSPTSSFQSLGSGHEH